MSNMADAIYKPLGSLRISVMSELLIILVFWGFLCVLPVFTMCVLLSMQPIFLDCLFLLAASGVSSWIICNYEKN